MSLLQRVKRVFLRGYATLINDKRPQPTYSYGWLNRLCGRLVDQHPAADIRPAYAWGVIQAAALARALGIPRVSVLEMGVAGGRGLVSLEQIAAQVERHIPVGIDVYGFDTGHGLPRPTDFRDHPNLYTAGEYAMEHDALSRRLTRAQLLLGDVAETIGPFISRALQLPSDSFRGISITTLRRWPPFSCLRLPQGPCCRGSSPISTTSWA